MPLASWKELALHLLFPRTCAGCRLDMHPVLQGPLCGACLARLEPARGPLCARCGASWEGPERCCPACRAGLKSVDAVRAALRYREPLPGLLYRFKYGGDRSLGPWLGAWLSDAFHAWPELKLSEACVPVPLLPARRRMRGFNQARLLASELAAAGGPPMRDILLRTGGLFPQWRFGRRERARRLLDAFALREGEAVRGARLLLVDDVCTSSGTLEGCARALRAAGAAEVKALVLARS